MLKSSSLVKVFVVVALVGGLFLLLSKMAPSASAGVCPDGTRYNPNPLTETCDGTTGVRCVLTSFGYSPTVDLRAPLGPWCSRNQ